ncbi:MAG: hypothetical protein O7A62_04415 [Alphaproteobacteria bacterium]|nr:hypothetical protein [Alphaproteobacteria bacterium]
MAVCAALFLAACAGTPNPAPPTEPAAARAPDTAPPQTERPQPPPARAAVREGVPVVPAPDPNPEILIGLAPDAVDNLLGVPDLVRRDGPAEVRIYREPQNRCTFHVFLYVNAAAGPASAVEYYEARDKDGRIEGADIKECYRALVKPASTT